MDLMDIVPERGHLEPHSTVRRPSRNTGVMPAPKALWRAEEVQKAPLTLSNNIGHVQQVLATPVDEPPVMRWDGVTRRTQSWDGLRRVSRNCSLIIRSERLIGLQDPELWFTGGNCNIYLCARGQSRRGPSFRVDFETIVASKM